MFSICTTRCCGVIIIIILLLFYLLFIFYYYYHFIIIIIIYVVFGAQSDGRRGVGDVRSTRVVSSQHHIWTAHRLALRPAHHHIQFAVDKYVLLYHRLLKGHNIMGVLKFREKK